MYVFEGGGGRDQWSLGQILTKHHHRYYYTCFTAIILSFNYYTLKDDKLAINL